MPEFVIYTSFTMLALAAFLGFARLIKGPSLPDRVVALELISAIVVGMIAVHTVATGKTSFLDVATVMALMAFLAAIGFARFLEEGGRRDA
jgi:multicomponent Na+:H+ antiporter subunit F